jgi:glutamyl-Q tRNA(Asp) synthetase
VPAAVNAAGEKLSKQTGARPIDAAHRERAICNALRFLGQVPTADLEEAIANWDANRIPRRRAIPGGDE